MAGKGEGWGGSCGKGPRKTPSWSSRYVKGGSKNKGKASSWRKGSKGEGRGKGGKGEGARRPMPTKDFLDRQLESYFGQNAVKATLDQELITYFGVPGPKAY